MLVEEEVAGLCASKVFARLSLRLSDKFLLLCIKVEKIVEKVW